MRGRCTPGSVINRYPGAHEGSWMYCGHQIPLSAVTVIVCCREGHTYLYPKHAYLRTWTLLLYFSHCCTRLAVFIRSRRRQTDDAEVELFVVLYSFSSTAFSGICFSFFFPFFFLLFCIFRFFFSLSTYLGWWRLYVGMALHHLLPYCIAM